MNFGFEWSGGSEWLIRSWVAVAWLWLLTRCPAVRGSRAWVWVTTSLALLASIPWWWHGGDAGVGWGVGGVGSSSGLVGWGCTGLWMAGGAAVLVRRVGGWWRVHTWCRDGEPLSEQHRWHRAWVQAATGFGLPSDVRVRLVAGLRTPAVWVGRRTWLLIPRSAGDWPMDTCRRVCLHEAGHVRGGDCRLQWLWLAVDVLQWWNPLWWRMRARLELELEKLADARVVADAGGSPREYVGDLLACAERGMAMPGVASWGGDGGGLEERVDALLRRTGTRPVRGLVAGIVVVTVLVLAALFHGPAPAADTADTAAARIHSDADLRLTATPFPAD